MQSLVKRYVKQTNHTLHMTRVAKCCHNLHNCLHNITSLHRRIKDSIGKCHRVTIFPERLTLECQILEKNSAINLLHSCKQGRTRVMLPDSWWITEPLLKGFGCVTATQEALVTHQGQADRERPLGPRSILPVDASSG